MRVSLTEELAASMTVGIIDSATRIVFHKCGIIQRYVILTEEMCFRKLKVLQARGKQQHFMKSLVKVILLICNPLSGLS